MGLVVVVSCQKLVRTNHAYIIYVVDDVSYTMIMLHPDLSCALALTAFLLTPGLGGVRIMSVILYVDTLTDRNQIL